MTSLTQSEANIFGDARVLASKASTRAGGIEAMIRLALRTGNGVGGWARNYLKTNLNTVILEPTDAVTQTAA